MNARWGSFLVAALFLSLTLGQADDKPVAKKADNDREVHVVGIYEGFTKSDGKIHGGKARVEVRRPDKSVTLVLVSYTPVTWEITLDPKTRIEKVILGGGGKSAVKGLPEKTEVVEAFRGSKEPKLAVYAYKVDAPGFRAIVEAIDGMTKQKVANFAGVYRADPENPLVIEEVSSDEQFSIDYPKPADPAKLPKLTFQAHREIGGKYPHEVTRSFGEFTLTGVKADTLQPLPDHVSRITYDPVGKKHYGIYRHKLAEIDMVKKKVKELDAGLQVPEISWPADVAFDTKRERVLLTSSGGGGILYAYYPKTDMWDALAEKPANAIVYHPKDDIVYGLKGDLGGRTPPVLQHINEKGAVVDSMTLEGPFLPGIFALGPGTGSVQLAAAGDKLVMLINPVGLRGGSEAPTPKWSYIYLLDQKTGKAQLVWKEKTGEK